MYTSGTTGEPKGVIIKNEAFMSEVLSIDQMLSLTDKGVRYFISSMIHLFHLIILLQVLH